MIKQFFHIFLALYLLAITAGVAINKHYCAGEVVSFSVYLKAQPCGDMDESMKGSCCRDVSVFFQLDEDVTSKQSLDFLFSPDFLFSIPEFTFLEDIFPLDHQTDFNKQIAYSPPLIASDIPVEVQSFLL